MTDVNAKDGGAEEKPAPEAQAENRSCGAGRMHENVPVWSDPVCSCEAEPYWVAVADEVENDLKIDERRTRET